MVPESPFFRASVGGISHKPLGVRPDKPKLAQIVKFKGKPQKFNIENHMGLSVAQKENRTRDLDIGALGVRSTPHIPRAGELK